MSVSVLCEDFLTLLVRLGVTHEKMSACLADPDGYGWRCVVGFLSPVSEPLWRLVPGNSNAIEVNLGAEPKIPMGAKIAWRWGRQTGYTLVERREDGELYQDGRKVVLHLEPEQVSRILIRGTVIQKRLKISGQAVVLHPNIKTALMVPENRHLIPESWKRNEAGNGLVIAFWGIGFRFIGAGCCVEHIFFYDGEWREDCGNLRGLRLASHPIALVI